MNEEKRIEALDVALNNELNEREFYLKHAARTHNLVGREMFERIAHEELEHYQTLKELHKTWLSKDKWPSSVPLSVNNINIQLVLRELIDKVGDAPKADIDDLEAIAIAADFEEKGAQFYIELSKSAADKNEKAFFELLASIERGHYLSLKEAQEYMKDPASWFLKKEHHSLDGA